MTGVNNDDSFGENFTGTAPLVEQSHTVLFPGRAQLLRVVDPCVRQMLTKAHHDERLIAFAWRQPEWENKSALQQTGHEMACLARIVNHVHDGKETDLVYIQGICRARVHREPISGLPDEFVRLELLRDYVSTDPVIDRTHRRTELFTVFRQIYPQIRRNDLFQNWAAEDLPLGQLCDQLTGALRVESARMQQILAEVDVDCRSDLLLALLRELAKKRREPEFAQPSIPGFSSN